METKLAPLCLPLQTLVDFMGRRLVAVLLLPIGSETLVVGTADGGQTSQGNFCLFFISSNLHLTARDYKLIEMMNQIGKKLNLAEHMAGHGPTFLPADAEGHIGEDGRRYLVDLSRVFPPSFSRPSKMNPTNLYQLFRPEVC